MTCVSSWARSFWPSKSLGLNLPGAKDEVPDGDEFLEQVSGRVYDLLMDELEQSFESR